MSQRASLTGNERNRMLSTIGPVQSIEILGMEISDGPH